jgi:hypothetical protein
MGIPCRVLASPGTRQAPFSDLPRTRQHNEKPNVSCLGSIAIGWGKAWGNYCPKEMISIFFSYGGRFDSIDAASTKASKKTVLWTVFFRIRQQAAGIKPASAGRCRGFEPHAASLRSDLRLQAQGSPIRPTKGKSPSDFLPSASTGWSEAPRRRRFFHSDNIPNATIRLRLVGLAGP